MNLCSNYWPQIREAHLTKDNISNNKWDKLKYLEDNWQAYHIYLTKTMA